MSATRKVKNIARIQADIDFLVAKSRHTEAKQKWRTTPVLSPESGDPGSFIRCTEDILHCSREAIAAMWRYPTKLICTTPRCFNYGSHPKSSERARRPCHLDGRESWHQSSGMDIANGCSGG